MAQFACLGLIFRPTPSLAFDIGDLGQWGEFAQNSSVIVGTYRVSKELVANGVKSIPDPNVRTAGTACGLGTAICTGMGWKQKTMVCFHGAVLCSGVATGLSEANPSNPVTVPGKMAGQAVEEVVERMSA